MCEKLKILLRSLFIAFCVTGTFAAGIAAVLWAMILMDSHHSILGALSVPLLPMLLWAWRKEYKQMKGK